MDPVGRGTRVLKCPLALWEATGSVSDLTILSRAASSNAVFFLLRDGITGWCETINNQCPWNMNECKELILLLYRVPAAAVLKKQVRRAGMLADCLVTSEFRQSWRWPLVFPTKPKGQWEWLGHPSSASRGLSSTQRHGSNISLSSLYCNRKSVTKWADPGVG